MSEVRPRIEAAPESASTLNPGPNPSLVLAERAGMEPTQEFTDSCIDRFWAKVARRDESECWEWTAARNAAGYGQFRVSGSLHSPVNAHRVAYEMTVGAIPEGYHVDHLCRNRGCVNPSHLEPVTLRVNTLRGMGATALNARKTHCKRGHEFTPENTYQHPLGRNCKACQRVNADARRTRSDAGMPAETP